MFAVKKGKGFPATFHLILSPNDDLWLCALGVNKRMRFLGTNGKNCRVGCFQHGAQTSRGTLK